MTAAALGAFVVFEDEAGFSMTPPQARTWGRRGLTPVVRVRGRSWRRWLIAAMCCYRPGDSSRLIYRPRRHRKFKGKRRDSFAWSDYRDLVVRAGHLVTVTAWPAGQRCLHRRRASRAHPSPGLTSYPAPARPDRWLPCRHQAHPRPAADNNPRTSVTTASGLIIWKRTVMRSPVPGRGRSGSAGARLYPVGQVLALTIATTGPGCRCGLCTSASDHGQPRKVPLPPRSRATFKRRANCVTCSPINVSNHTRSAFTPSHTRKMSSS